MDRSFQDQVLKVVTPSSKLFQSLFSKEQLRKNLYIFQHLSPDMTLRTKVIYQERKVAAITKDHTIILACLKKCPLVQVIDFETIKLLASGDLLIVKIYGKGPKPLLHNEIKKMLNPILKDIKHEVKANIGDEKLAVMFNSETSVAEFIERVKGKNLPIGWEFEEKDPYQCIKKSIGYLLKERKNQSHQEQTYNSAYYYNQNYQSYFNPGNYQSNEMSPYSYQTIYNSQKYEIFIRKSVQSGEEQNQSQNPQNKKEEESNGEYRIKSTKQKGEQKEQPKAKLNVEDFPQL